MMDPGLVADTVSALLDELRLLSDRPWLLALALALATVKAGRAKLEAFASRWNGQATVSSSRLQIAVPALLPRTGNGR